MSIRFQIAKRVAALVWLKKMFALPDDELLAAARKMNKNRDFKIPRRNLRYEDRIILNRWHCLKAQTGEKTSRRALLFLFGGGTLIGLDDGDVKLAEKLGLASGRDVWFPWYPLCTDHSIREIYETAFEVYRQMLLEYDPQDIAFTGFSSGAALSIGIWLYNNAQETPLPMLGLIIAVSPGCVPMSDAVRRRMDELSKVDFLIDSKFMTTVRKFMEHGETVPDYMLSGICGDFSGFPMTHFWYGSDEVLYAAAPEFEQAYKKYGANYEMHAGEGLCHC